MDRLHLFRAVIRLEGPLQVHKQIKTVIELPAVKSLLSLLQCYLRVVHSRVSIPELLLILFNSVKSKLDTSKRAVD